MLEATNSINLVGDSSAVDLGGQLPSRTVDTSGTYNELCQLFLCYVIEFNTAADITPGSIKLIISDMLNPESV